MTLLRAGLPGLVGVGVGIAVVGHLILMVADARIAHRVIAPTPDGAGVSTIMAMKARPSPELGVEPASLRERAMVPGSGKSSTIAAAGPGADRVDRRAGGRLRVRLAVGDGIHA